MTMVVTPRLFDTYMSVIEGSEGTTMFRHLYADVDGEKKDVADDGDLSCAFYVSSVLSMFDLCDRVHGTVDGTVRAMNEMKWHIISEPQKGAVVVWGPKVGTDGSVHKHIGFCVNENEVMSNIASRKVPGRHALHDAEGRVVEAIYWHDNLR